MRQSGNRARGYAEAEAPSCLVTGGAGFIGSHLVEALVGRGWKVRVLDDLSTGSRENLAAVASRIEFVQGDVRDAALVERCVEGTRVVFHLAALGSVEVSVRDPLRAHEINAGGTLNVVLGAAHRGVRTLVYSSTCAVYGNRPPPVDEDDLPEPLSPYAAAKLAGEHYCRVYGSLSPGLRVFILRYFNVYGPRQSPRSDYAAVIPRFVTRLLEGRPPVIFGDGSQTRDFVYVSDVVEANLACAESAGERGGATCNIGSGRGTSVRELARLLGSLAGFSGAPELAEPRVGDIRHSWAAVERAAAVLNWRPQVTLEEGLRRTLEWFAQRR